MPSVILRQDQPLKASGLPAEAGSGTFPSRQQLFVLLAAYFALQVVIRTLLSNSADLDEAEQVLLAQRLAWGYGSQPPLYTWIQIAFFSAFGTSIFSLSLFKNLLLFCIYVFTYSSARRMTRSHLAGAAAAISLLCLPEVAWESQRDLTHSVIASTLAMATLWCLVCLSLSRKTRWFALLGACAGLGLVSKYNYAFWLLGLVLAACSLRELRRLFLDRRMLLALIVATPVFLPNGLWMLHHRGEALAATSKFDFNQSASWLWTAGVGLWNIATATASYAGPLLLIALIVFHHAPKRPALPETRVYRRLLFRALLIVCGASILLVLGFRATDLRGRWLEPVLVCLPTLGAVCLHERIDEGRLKILAGFGLCVMAAVSLIMPGRILLAEPLHREEPLNRPYAALAAQIRPLLQPSTLIVARSRLLAGNLRLNLPRRTVVTPETADLFPAPASRQLLVWNASLRPALPETLREWAKRFSVDLRKVRPRYFTALYKFHRRKRMTLAVIELQEPPLRNGGVSSRAGTKPRRMLD